MNEIGGRVESAIGKGPGQHVLYRVVDSRFLFGSPQLERVEFYERLDFGSANVGDNRFASCIQLAPFAQCR